MHAQVDGELTTVMHQMIEDEVSHHDDSGHREQVVFAASERPWLTQHSIDRTDQPRARIRHIVVELTDQLRR